MDSYFTIKDIEEILYKDKASKFIGFAYYVKDEKEIHERLELARNIHPKATHHCYAYRLGTDKNNFRTNDDGEPSGSAGKPILGQIDSFGVTNCLVIVVPYFGGTKLGIPGLISAYKETAKTILSSTEIIEQKILCHYFIECDYTALNGIYQLISSFNAAILQQKIDHRSSFTIAIQQNKKDVFENKLKEERIQFRSC